MQIIKGRSPFPRDGLQRGAFQATKSSYLGAVAKGGAPRTSRARRARAQVSRVIQPGEIL